VGLTFLLEFFPLEVLYFREGLTAISRSVIRQGVIGWKCPPHFLCGIIKVNSITDTRILGRSLDPLETEA
jgi:hypothetical protein